MLDHCTMNMHNNITNNSTNALWYDYDDHYRKLAKKEKELKEREAVIRQKERDYVMTAVTHSSFAYDRVSVLCAFTLHYNNQWSNEHRNIETTSFLYYA